MKRNLFGALAMIVLAAAINVPAVQAQQQTRADVPFAFQAGDHVFPAGAYSVSLIAEHGIMIRNVESNESLMLVVQNMEKLDPQSPKLVFHASGNQYLLREVWNGSNFGMSVPISHQEKELRLAKENAASSAAVMIALR